MLTFAHQIQDGTSLLTISGQATEDAHIPPTIEKLSFAPRIKILCKGVTRFNSVGVKKWIGMMRKFREDNPKAEILFAECSVSIVEQINLYGNSFTAGGEVISLDVPFRCEACGKQMFVMMHAEEVRRTGFEIADKPCSQCGKPATFDDFPAEYFACLTPKNNSAK